MLALDVKCVLRLPSKLLLVPMSLASTLLLGLLVEMLQTAGLLSARALCSVLLALIQATLEWLWVLDWSSGVLCSDDANDDADNDVEGDDPASESVRCHQALNRCCDPPSQMFEYSVEVMRPTTLPS
jgi:hypothetical protein